MINGHLTQPEIDARRIVLALNELATISTDPKHGWAVHTLKGVHKHIRKWDKKTKIELKQSIERILGD